MEYLGEAGVGVNGRGIGMPGREGVEVPLEVRRGAGSSHLHPNSHYPRHHHHSERASFTLTIIRAASVAMSAPLTLSGKITCYAFTSILLHMRSSVQFTVNITIKIIIYILILLLLTLL